MTVDFFVERKKIIVMSVSAALFIITGIFVLTYRDAIIRGLKERLLLVTKHEVNFSKSSAFVSRKDIDVVLGQTLAKNILDIDTEKLEEKFLKNPWIREVRVEKVFPNAISVDVKPYHPIAILVLDHLYFIDENFAIFKRVERRDSYDFMFITGLKTKEELETRVELKECMSFLENHKALEVAEVNFNEKEGITLFLANSKSRVALGLDEYTKKLEHLTLMYTDLKNKNINFDFINLSTLAQGVVQKANYKEEL